MCECVPWLGATVGYKGPGLNKLFLILAVQATSNDSHRPVTQEAKQLSACWGF